MLVLRGVDTPLNKRRNNMDQKYQDIILKDNYGDIKFIKRCTTIERIEFSYEQMKITCREGKDQFLTFIFLPKLKGHKLIIE